jgi:hypothetical protein
MGVFSSGVCGERRAAQSLTPVLDSCMVFADVEHEDIFQRTPGAS